MYTIKSSQFQNPCLVWFSTYRLLEKVVSCQKPLPYKTWKIGIYDQGQHDYTFTNSPFISHMYQKYITNANSVTKVIIFKQHFWPFCICQFFPACERTRACFSWCPQVAPLWTPHTACILMSWWLSGPENYKTSSKTVNTQNKK